METPPSSAGTADSLLHLARQIGLNIFVGSELTGTAAALMARQYIDIELDQKYRDIANQRMTRMHPRMTLR